MGIFMDSSHHVDFGRKDVFSKSGEEKREGEIFQEIVIVLQEFDVERNALRVIPRGKQWLTVCRAHPVFVETYYIVIISKSQFVALMCREKQWRTVISSK